MQRNIATKFAAYMLWILVCKHYEFDDKIYYNSTDIEFLLGDYFLLARPVHWGPTDDHGHIYLRKKSSDLLLNGSSDSLHVLC